MEYCNNEQFSASCAPGMTVTVTAAFYGRMQLGRCVSANYGYLGCKADVTDIMNSRCSGQQSCGISIPDEELEATDVCHSDLLKYLAINYTCEALGFNAWESNYPVLHYYAISNSHFKLEPLIFWGVIYQFQVLQ